MSRTVFCRKYQQDLEGLERPPFPGPRGEEIFTTVSKRAWLEWQNHQTMLINEKELTVTDPEARQFLQEQMEKFFSGDDFEKAEGYTPKAP